MAAIVACIFFCSAFHVPLKSARKEAINHLKEYAVCVCVLCVCSEKLLLSFAGDKSTETHDIPYQSDDAPDYALWSSHTHTRQLHQKTKKRSDWSNIYYPSYNEGMMHL